MNKLTSILFLTLVLLCNPTHAETKTELYQRIFGNKFAPAKTSAIPLIVDNVIKSEVTILLTSDNKISIQKESILPFLQTILSKENYIKLVKTLAKSKFISKNQFTENNITPYYNENELTLRLNIPINIRKLSTIALSGSGNKNNLNKNNYFKPADLSAYINTAISLDKTETSSSLDEGADLELNKVINYKGWILESTSNHNEYQQDKPQTSNTTLTKDFYNNAGRLIAGDITLPRTGFQRSFSSQGIKFNKYISLDPYQYRHNSGEYTFELKYRSSVKIHINNIYYKTLYLDPGNYNLKDFPISFGINDIKLIVENSFNKKEIFEFPLFSNNQLLKEKSYEYGIGVGYAKIGSLIPTNYEHAIVSSFYRQAMKENYTLGINFQNYQSVYLVGFENHFLNKWGLFSIAPAISSAAKNSTGLAIKVDYATQRLQTKNKKKQWNFTVTLYDKNFQTPSISNSKNTIAKSISAGVTIPFKDSSLVLRTSLQQSLTSQKLKSQYSVYFSQKISKQFSWRATAYISEDDDESFNENFNLNLTYNFDDRRSRISSSYNNENESYLTNFNTSSIAGINLSANIDHSKSTSQESVRTTLRHSNQRLITQLKHHTSLNDTKYNNTQLLLRTAIVYADGYFSVSKPVSNNFAIFVPPASIIDNEVILDPIGDLYAAKSDFFGKAVLANLTPYTSRKVSIDLPSLPIGYAIGSGEAYISPTYKSGTLVTIEGEKSVYLQAQLTNNLGEPLKLITGKITEFNSKDNEATLFFTNAKGEFQAAGLKSGKYNVTLILDETKTTILNIPSNATGVYNAGKLLIE